MDNRERAFNSLVAYIEEQKRYSQLRLADIDRDLDGEFIDGAWTKPYAFNNDNDRQDMREMRKREMRVNSTLYTVLEKAYRIRERGW